MRSLYVSELLLGFRCPLELYARFHNRLGSERAAPFAAFQAQELARVRRCAQGLERRVVDVGVGGNADLRAGDHSASREPETPDPEARAAEPCGTPAHESAERGLDPAACRRVQATRRAIERYGSDPRYTIWNAVVEGGGVLAHVDILQPRPDGTWYAALVRSGTGLRGGYFDEMRLVRFCLESAGLPVSEYYVYYLDKNYRSAPGASVEPDPAELFVQSRVTKKIRKGRENTGERVRRLRELLSRDASVLDEPSEGCTRGQRCRICARFEPELPHHHIFTLHRGGHLSRELYDQGIASIHDIPEQMALSDKQEVQRNAVLADAAQVDHASLESFLDRITYPVSFLDFEAFQRGVPTLPAVAAWQHIPFQYSLHVLEAEAGKPEHYGFIADSEGDPRVALTRRLLDDLPEAGSILVFGAEFERSIIAELAYAFPEEAERLEGVRERIQDLATPFHQFLYYHPEQRGKTSLKRVLPVLTEHSYEGLPINDGMEASLAYYFMRHDKLLRFFGEDWRTVRERLDRYCGLDTYALVAILARLRELVNGGGAGTG